jgi:3'-phosphoadenosine 5'-phosphosulfate sulfotransferase (PAPS reductase)/FAD synthetase
VSAATIDVRSDFPEIADPALERWSPQEILTWAIGKFHPRLALSCSFGNPEGLVLLDMMHRIEPSSRVYVLDTGRLPQATYDLIDRIRDRCDKQVEVLPRAEDVEAMVRAARHESLLRVDREPAAVLPDPQVEPAKRSHRARRLGVRIGATRT